MLVLFPLSRASAPAPIRASLWSHSHSAPQLIPRLPPSLWSPIQSIVPPIPSPRRRGPSRPLLTSPDYTALPFVDRRAPPSAVWPASRSPLIIMRRPSPCPPPSTTTCCASSAICRATSARRRSVVPPVPPPFPTKPPSPPSRAAAVPHQAALPPSRAPAVSPTQRDRPHPSHCSQS